MGLLPPDLEALFDADELDFADVLALRVASYRANRWLVAIKAALVEAAVFGDV